MLAWAHVIVVPYVVAVGAVIGTAVTGFWLIEWAGVLGSTRWAAGLHVLIGLLGLLVPLLPARAVAPADLNTVLPEGPLLLAGDAVEAARGAPEMAGREVLAAAAPGQADAEWVAALAAGQPLPEPGAPPPEPIYLRGPDVTLARPAGTGRGAV